MSLQQDTEEKLVALLHQAIPSLYGIYLFGSAAAGEMREDSDIDIAVLAEQALPPVELWGLAQKLASVAARDVDLVDLRTASAVMRVQVVANGRRIASFDRLACEDFEDFVYSDYARLNEERAGILADVQQRGSVYG